MKVLRLNTVENSRRTLAAMIREYHKGNLEESNFRALVYGMSKLLEFFRVEKDLEIEKRLEEIESKLGGDK